MNNSDILDILSKKEPFLTDVLQYLIGKLPDESYQVMLEDLKAPPKDQIHKKAMEQAYELYDYYKSGGVYKSRPYISVRR